MCKCAFNTCTKPGQLFVLGWFTFLYTGKQWGLNSRFKVFPIWFDLLHISSEWLKEYYVWNGWECARWFKAINMSLIRFICFFLFVDLYVKESEYSHMLIHSLIITEFIIYAWIENMILLIICLKSITQIPN